LVTLSRLHRAGLVSIFQLTALRGSPFAGLIPDAGETRFRKSQTLLPFHADSVTESMAAIRAVGYRAFT